MPIDHITEGPGNQQSTEVIDRWQDPLYESLSDFSSPYNRVGRRQNLWAHSDFFLEKTKGAKIFSNKRFLCNKMDHIAKGL